LAPVEGIAAQHFSVKTKAAGKTATEAVGKTATEASRSCPASVFNISLPTFGTFSVRKIIFGTSRYKYNIKEDYI